MRLIITGDGSPTLYNQHYKEAYHCTNGAIAEATGKYAEPCRVAELARSKGKVRILDVCFGLGYNACAALDAVINAAPEAMVQIVGLEKDPDALQAIADLYPNFKNYGIIKDLAAKPGESLIRGNVAMRLCLGDATETIYNLDGSFDVAFHDPFSPRKNPDMWTSDFFSHIHTIIEPGGVLATYSCAGHVRQNLRDAGFSVTGGPALNRRGPSTLAYKIA